MRYFYEGCREQESECDIRIHNNIVIATEIPENPGIHIAQMSAELATRICHEFFIEPRRLIWIEYDPEKSGWKGSQDKWYELVEFDLNKEKGVFSNPRRLPVTPEVVKTLREKDGAKHHG